jgi:hypothetical protein
MVCYHADEDGYPGEPMNQAEMIQAYWEAADDNPHSLDGMEGWGLRSHVNVGCRQGGPGR